MLIRLLIMCIVVTLLTICFAIISFKRKWYFACGLNVAVAICDLTILAIVIDKYFIH